MHTPVLTIFVIDDDPDQATLLALALGGPERQVRAFSDPIRALEALATESADLLICDVSMPWMSGAQVAATVQEKRPGMPIILVSAYARGAELAADTGLPFFPKPLPLDELRAAVGELLATVEQASPSSTDHPTSAPGA